MGQEKMNERFEADNIEHYDLKRPESVSSMRILGDGFNILHDSAPIHRSAIVRNFLAFALPNRVHLYPPYSPDLNPIENLGNLPKRKIRQLLKVRNMNLEMIFRSAWAWPASKMAPRLDMGRAHQNLNLENQVLHPDIFIFMDKDFY